VIKVVRHPNRAEKAPDIPSVVQDVIDKHSSETGLVLFAVIFPLQRMRMVLK
jgi:hypothetical protein